MSDRLQHVHPTREAVSSVELSPPHPPRTETPAYVRAHKRLIDELDTPCWVCGARRSEGASIESHHYPIERSLAAAVDVERLAADYPSVRDYGDFMDWVDSEHNLICLCAEHHRGPQGIHHTLAQDFLALKYARRDPATGRPYIFAASPQDAAAAEAFDEQLLRDLAHARADQPAQPARK